MSKVIVIGGGASGLVSAIYAAKENNEVIILERNSTCGKKILITGNGRCNYYNDDQDINNYHTSSNIDLTKIINEESNVENLKFFESIGIMPKIKNGYYYPLSNQATSILNSLVTEAVSLNIDIKNNILVKDIIVENNLFKIITDYEIYECDKVILATGSKAAPKTGSDGFGYELSKKLGHTVIKPLPSLVQLIANDKITSSWDGVRSDALVSIYVNDELQKEELGEIMLTDYGVSGICVFNLSSIAARNLDINNEVSLKINFVPNIELTVEWFNEFNSKVHDRTLSEILDGILNYKLVNAILNKNKIDRDSKWDELNDDKKELLINSLKSYELEIVGTNSFDKAQVCSGGVSLEEINLETMESKIISNLFIVGELLDVDGDCGGYNLNWAWTSGKLAGKGTKDHD